MNQRIEVRSLVRKDGKILLLKRSAGREDLRGKYELPGGDVRPTEQPEDAMRRHIEEATNLKAQSSYLADVFTYHDQTDRDIQRAVIVYVASTAGSNGDIKLEPKYGRYAWRKLSEITQEEVTDLTYLLLTMYQDKPGVSATADGVKIKGDVDYATKKQGVVVLHSDGGSRGNPGPSAAGYSIRDQAGKLAYEGGAYLGITTNNQAEYHGVRLGLEKAKELGATSVECYVDSMLVVNQLNGKYVIRNRELWPIHERIKELVGKFEKVTFRHVKREFNQQADGMVNKILDTRANNEKIRVY